MAWRSPTQAVRCGSSPPLPRLVWPRAESLQGPSGGANQWTGDDEIECDAATLPFFRPRVDLCLSDIGERRIVSSLVHHFVIGAGAAVSHQGYLLSTAQPDFQSWFVGFPFCFIGFNRAASIARVIRGRRCRRFLELIRRETRYPRISPAFPRLRRKV